MSFIVAALIVSAQVADQPAAVAPPAAAPAVAAPKVKEKKICKVDDADSGSHMVRRTCLTEQEWQERGQGVTNSSRSGVSVSGEAMQGH